MSPPPIYYGAQRVAPSGISKAYVGSTEVYSEGTTIEDYLWMRSDSSFSVNVSKTGTPDSVYYSFNKSDWALLWTFVPVNANTKIFFKSKMAADNTGSRYNNFSISGSGVHVGGKLSSMIGETERNYGCYRLFYNCTSIVDASKLFVQDITGQRSLGDLLRGCINLIAPCYIGEGDYSSRKYYYMFSNCSSLKITTDSTVSGAKYFFTPKETNTLHMFANTYDTSLDTPVVNTPYYYYQ